MTAAPAAAVAAVMEVLLCKRQPAFNRCAVHEFRTWDGQWTDRGCPVAVAAADAAVEAATPGIQAGALRAAADEWQSRLKSTHPLDVEVADRIVGWLSLRADRIEPRP